MLLLKIDEKGHVHRDPDYERKRQKELERLGYHLIRINPNKIDFNDYEEFGRVQKQINESTKRQTEQPLIDGLPKRLLELELKSNYSTKTKCLKWVVENMLPTI